MAGVYLDGGNYVSWLSTGPIDLTSIPEVKYARTLSAIREEGIGRLLIRLMSESKTIMQLSEEMKIDLGEVEGKIKELVKLGLVQDQRGVYSLTGKGVQATLILVSLGKLLVGDTKGWATSLSTEYSR